MTTNLKAMSVLVVGLWFAGGCAGNQALRNRDSPERGFAFGRIEVHGTNIAVTRVILRRADRVTFGALGERTTLASQSGYFFSHNLEPGLYQMQGFRSGDMEFFVGSIRDPETFWVRPGVVSYAGTFRILYVERGLLEKDDKGFARDNTPASEAGVLEWLLGEVAATDWTPLVNARLRELRPPLPSTVRSD